MANKTKKPKTEKRRKTKRNKKKKKKKKKKRKEKRGRTKQDGIERVIKPHKVSDMKIRCIYKIHI
jgi:hypothetical protein